MRPLSQEGSGTLTQCLKASSLHPGNTLTTTNRIFCLNKHQRIYNLARAGSLNGSVSLKDNIGESFLTPKLKCVTVASAKLQNGFVLLLEQVLQIQGKWPYMVNPQWISKPLNNLEITIYVGNFMLPIYFLVKARHNILFRVYWYCQKMPLYIFVPCMLVAFFLISFILSCCGVTGVSDELENSKRTTIVLAIFFAPVIETLACQFIPIEASQAYFNNVFHKKYYGLSIILSALIFSAIHYYNLNYLIVTFFEGLLLAFGFMTQRKKGYIKSFISIALVHLLWNCFAVVTHF